MRFRGILVVVMVAALLNASVGMAFAVVQKTGSQSCSPPTGQVMLRSYGSGTVRHYWPSGTLRQIFSNPSPVARHSATGVASTSWKVTATGTLSSPGTYSYCSGV